MEQDAKSRLDAAVPKPESAQALSEEEKRALEKGGEIEHQVGEQKEQTAQQAAGDNETR